LLGAGSHSRSPGDRVLPHRRALEPDMVRAEAFARLPEREELRRLLDRVGESGRRARREMKPEDYSRRQQELSGWPVTIETYKLGDVYHCTIANVDPGARFARADGATREEAERVAIEKATRHLEQTRKFDI